MAKVLYLFIGLILCIFPYSMEGQGRRKITKGQDIISHMDIDSAGLKGAEVPWAIDTIFLKKKGRKIVVQMGERSAYNPIREYTAPALEILYKEALGRRFRKWKLDATIEGKPFEYYIPNYYRKDAKRDKKRNVAKIGERTPIVKRIGYNYPTQGLTNSNIALWHSHGIYYNSKYDKWLWQRAPLFETIEDFSPMSYVLPYLIPMLENAGANTFIARERDLNRFEIIVDADKKSPETNMTVGSQWSGDRPGFMMKDTLYDGENPFQMGSSFSTKTSRVATDSITYSFSTPISSEAAVYLSWAESNAPVSDVKYRIIHAGGEANLSANQTMGSATWVYAGSFYFKKNENYQITVYNQSSEDGIITSDAIRIGGGMGNIARRDTTGKGEWKTSGYPRYAEGARYNFQYSGIPDSLVYLVSTKHSDYVDDYASRGEWVNYLQGAPNGPSKDRQAKGLNIPIDLAFAFHTDAGVSKQDDIIGTLAIYSSESEDSTGTYPEGGHKIASRDLSDIIQTQIVEDIRALHVPDWRHRGMWDKKYSEAFRPTVPTMLLELLSHQNFADAMWGHEPSFKFDVSRSIYKGMLRFLADQRGVPYTIQPLPVSHLAIEAKGNQRVRISWQPTDDPLEPTAKPHSYRIFTRKGDGGFDEGVITTQPFIEMNLSDDAYSFKVAAINDGGESLASEVLSAYLPKGNQSQPVLIVNGFDRLSAPGIIGGKRGIGIDTMDNGVAYMSKVDYIGAQYDYNRNAEWESDENPGWGASSLDHISEIIKGNSQDFTYQHGQLFKALNIPYISVSDEVFENMDINTKDFAFIDLLLGEEKTSYYFGDRLTKKNPRFRIYTPLMKKQLTQYLNAGGSLLISGAYIGSDGLEEGAFFTEEVLKFKHGSMAATNEGTYLSYANPFVETAAGSFNQEFRRDTYRVESPDEITPITGVSHAVLMFPNKKVSAVAYKGEYNVWSMTIPLEAIPREEATHLLKEIIPFLTE